MGTRACPHCGETIQNAAMLCRFCRQKVPVIDDNALSPAMLATAVAVVALGLGVAVWHESTKNYNPPHQQVEEAHVTGPAMTQASASKPVFDPDSFTLDIKGQLDRVDGLEEKLGEAALRGPLPAIASQVAQEANDEVDAEGRITYAMLKKNAQRYAGRAWFFRARIEQIQETDGVTFARVNILGEDDDQELIVAGRFETDFIDRNIVDVVGYLSGPHTYESQAGWKITLPSMALVGMYKNGTLEKILAANKRARRSLQK